MTQYKFENKCQYTCINKAEHNILYIVIYTRNQNLAFNLKTEVNYRDLLDL